MSELSDDDLKPVMNAIRFCEVGYRHNQPPHLSHVSGQCPDTVAAIRRLVAWREAQRIADWTNPDEHNHEPLLRMAAEAKRAYFGGE